MFFQSQASLIQKAQAGNKKAWLNLVTQHERLVFNHCLRLVGCREDARDLMQEVFISVYRSLAQFRGDSDFKTWLFRIVQYRAAEHYRRLKVHDSLEEEHEPESGGCGGEHEYMGQQKNQAIRDSLQALPWEQRLVVELKFFQHYTFEQIAEQLDISTNTAKSRLYSALNKLKVDLEAVDG